jgi:hypothetical protein
MTILESLEKNGHYKTARNLTNQTLIYRFGLDLDSLPDTTQVADFIETLADLLEGYPALKNEVRNHLNGLNNEFIENLILD